MIARWALGGILMIAAMAGAALYYFQVYAFYEPVSGESLSQIELTSILSGEVEPIVADNIDAIDSGSSPIRFRACFDSQTSLATMTETYQIYDDAVPLNAPGWFDCFDAGAIGDKLESGEAIAFLGTKNISYGVDRVIAVDASGQGYAWHQINICGEAAFGGDPLPQGCPPPPEGTAR